MKKRKTNNNGFSMMELILSLAIIGLALMFFMAVYFGLFKASQKGVDLTAGTTIAESELTQFMENLESNPAGLSSITTVTFPVTGSSTLNTTVFDYEINGSVVPNTDGNLYKVDIVVWWWAGDEEKAKRQGYGRLSVRMSRLVYLKYNPAYK
ncbi:MAG: type II secretion system protein [Vulcanimicrobiota bacterium]